MNVPQGEQVAKHKKEGSRPMTSFKALLIEVIKKYQQISKMLSNNASSNDSQSNTNPALEANPDAKEEKDWETITLPNDTVLVAGAGPVGLLLGTVLSQLGVKSVLLERNESTTKWPKMDLTNSRSMEQFRRLGLADSLRSKGVPPHIPSTVLISSGLSKSQPITAWRHPSVDEFRQNILNKNDGTMPLEPWQRISQSIFEKWLKSLCDEDPNIEPLFGWRVEQVEERDGLVYTYAVEGSTSRKRIYVSKYLAGCDGASSKVRRTLGIAVEGGPIPGYMLLIHFKSKDLSRLHSQGQFWHIFFPGEHGFRGAIIAQDEVDTWTTHLAMPLEADHEVIPSNYAVATVLGGMFSPYHIKIDEVLVRSTYRPYVAMSQHYRSSSGQIFLAGDSAHQNIPTGGYGMNMGLGDAFDLGWKLAACVKGFGGPGLLDSYEQERRPVALKLVERSGVHMNVHMKVAELLQPNPYSIDDDTEEGRAMRARIHKHYATNDGENTDSGVEMGYRYNSVAIVPDLKVTEPEWSPSHYTPTTWPGGRAPHVFLRDGTAIFDLYGPWYTLVCFLDGKEDLGTIHFREEAERQSVPMKIVRLVGEDHVRKIWESPMVFIRPDGHVAWRGLNANQATAATVLKIATGQDTTSFSGVIVEEVGKFTATVGTTVQTKEFETERIGDFQR